MYTLPDGADMIEPHSLKDLLVLLHFFKLLLHFWGLLDLLTSHELTGQPDTEGRSEQETHARMLKTP